MADADTARLCTEIVHTHFGPHTAQVVSVLLTRGRLPLPSIARYTQLKPRVVRASIIVLIQHNLLWHVKGDEGTEMFEVNVEDCLNRLRFGKVVYLANSLFGKAGADIVQVVLDHGKLKLPDILSSLGIYEHKSITVYKQAMYKLVHGNYLKPSTILSHISPKDKQIRYETEEKAKIVGFPTAKELREAKQVAEARLKREEAEAEKTGLKRKATEEHLAAQRGKKRKTGEEEDVINETVVFRVNFDKFSVHIRNNLIIEAAKKRYNSGAASVMKAVLKVTESSQNNVSEAKTEPISVPSVVMQLSDEEGLAKGLVMDVKKPSNAACIKEYIGMLSSGDNPTPAGKASSFVSFNSSKIQVEFDIVGRRLRRQVLESMAREKHGTEGVRIMRLLWDTGKLDEKQIAKVVMMAGKDVRPLLTALSADSLVSIQEVPKSADRNPTRTFYLWYVNQHKAFATVLGHVYKTLYNISVRRRAERDVPEVKAVLEKRERSDVRQDESLLTRLEREVLQEWETKLNKLTTLEMRVEETLFILKDLGVLGIDVD